MTSLDHAYILDNDGTLIQFGKELPGAKDLLSFLLRSNTPFVILSNTGEKGPQQISDTIKAVMDVTIPYTHIYTAHDHMLNWLVFNQSKFSTIRVIANESTFELLKSNGLDVLCLDESLCDDESKTCIALFSDGNISNYVSTLTNVAKYIIRGAELFITSGDVTLSKRYGNTKIDQPGPGMFLQNLHVLLKSQHAKPKIRILGKGGDESFMLKAEEMLKAQGFVGIVQNIRFIGDRFDTDIRAGNSRGMKTVLVETGCHIAKEQYLFPGDAADFVAESLHDVFLEHKEANFHQKKRLVLMIQKISRFMIQSGYCANSIIDRLLKDMDSLFSQPRRIKSCGDIASLC